MEDGIGMVLGGIENGIQVWLMGFPFTQYNSNKLHTKWTVHCWYSLYIQYDTAI